MNPVGLLQQHHRSPVLFQPRRHLANVMKIPPPRRQPESPLSRRPPRSRRACRTACDRGANSGRADRVQTGSSSRCAGEFAIGVFFGGRRTRWRWRRHFGGTLVRRGDRGSPVILETKEKEEASSAKSVPRAHTGSSWSLAPAEEHRRQTNLPLRRRNRRPRRNRRRNLHVCGRQAERQTTVRRDESNQERRQPAAKRPGSAETDRASHSARRCAG